MRAEVTCGEQPAIHVDYGGDGGTEKDLTQRLGDTEILGKKL
jgi:hypothetical protein